MLEFIKENSFIFLLLLPVIYIVTRDIVSIYKGKQQKKEDEIRLRESEERIAKLMKQLDVNRDSLLKQLTLIQNKIDLPDSTQDFNKNEQEKS